MSEIFRFWAVEIRRTSDLFNTFDFGHSARVRNYLIFFLFIWFWTFGGCLKIFEFSILQIRVKSEMFAYSMPDIWCMSENLILRFWSWDKCLKFFNFLIWIFSKHLNFSNISFFCLRDCLKALEFWWMSEILAF